MPKVDGMSLLRELRQRQHPVQVIIDHRRRLGRPRRRGDAPGRVRLPREADQPRQAQGAHPQGARARAAPAEEPGARDQLEAVTRFGEMVGQSEPMQAVYQMIERVAASTASVLILGESGTGKELVANALHRKSDRAKGPFFALNCAALPKEILENELFGHEKGAFTGSTNEKPGAFEMASGGTIFLDEVAEMSPDIQVKLLRALESRMVRRLGGKKEIPVDIRIVAATNKDMEKAIADGELRADLFLPAGGGGHHSPPLRERGRDVALIAQEFLTRSPSRTARSSRGSTSRRATGSTRTSGRATCASSRTPSRRR
jgi:DNA-binding NtrC family response regulator